MRFLLLCCTSLLLLASCNLKATGPDKDDGVPADTIHFRNVSVSMIPASIQPNSAKDVTSTDIGNDGDLDLVLAVQNGSNRLLLNNGQGAFTEQTPSVITNKTLDSEAAVAADFNGNAINDLLFASQQDQTNEFYLNQGHGVYLDISNQLPVTGVSLSAVAADVNNDGNADLVIGNDGQNFLLLNTGNAFFNPVPERIPSLQGITHGIAAGDLTGNGQTDLVVGNDINNQLLINTGAGYYERQTSARIPLNDAIEETRDVELADVNGDGATDLFFANVGFQTAADAQNRLLINNGNGVFGDSTATHLPALAANTVAADIIDLNGDTAPDIITGDYDGGIRVLINNGNGQFTSKTDAWIPAPVQPRVRDLLAADFNNDGLPDLYICSIVGNDLLLIQQQEK